MKFKFLLIGLFWALSGTLYAQTDTTENFSYPIPDSFIQNTTIDYPNSSDFDDVFLYESQLQAQKLLKNLFLGGFIFMTLVVIFLFYINQTKIKQVVSLLKVQEREIKIRRFEVEKLSTIINNTIDAIVIISKSGELLWNNSSFLQLYDYTEETIKDEKIDFFENDNSEIQTLIDKCKNEIKPVQFTFDIKNKKNNDVYIHRRIIPITDSQNEDINYAIIDTDYTALKLATKK